MKLPLVNAFKPVMGTLLASQAVTVIMLNAQICVHVLLVALMDVSDALIQFAIQYWCCILMTLGEHHQ